MADELCHIHSDSTIRGCYQILTDSARKTAHLSGFGVAVSLCVCVCVAAVVSVSMSVSVSF